MRTINVLFLIIIFNIAGNLSSNSFNYNEDLIYAQVEQVKMLENANGTWTINVTISHEDTGWNHYADLWVVVNRDTEEILGSRVLAHPHVGEQPFTRGLSGVQIPEGTRFIEIRGKCNLHGFEGKRILINMDEREGPGYSIE